MADQNPLLLAANGPSLDPRLLPLLRAKPSLASAQDAHGYSLLHAAASYSHADLLRALVHEFHVDINLRDEDGETCLFVAESVDVARVIVEELAVDVSALNDEGMTASQKVVEEGEFPDLARYLEEVMAGQAGAGAEGVSQAIGVSSSGGDQGESAGRLPPLPPNVSLNIGGVADEAAVGEADPEFRRRIEELASRENFNTDEGQRELRDLIADAVRDVSAEQPQPDARRRRVD